MGNYTEELKKIAEQLSNEELNNAIAMLGAETKKRAPKQNFVVYRHCCHNESKHHLRKYKHWCKLVKDVDLSKANGYAFIGEFLSVTQEHMVPVGSIVVDMCSPQCIAYRVTGDYEKEKIACQDYRSMFPLIKAVAEALGK